MIGCTVGHYRIVAELGAGGMGIVYKAWDERLERFLALKFLKPERVSDDFRRRFLQEARASSALQHPNIVHVYDIGVFEGQDFIAMEYVDGASLRQTLLQQRLSVSEAVRYAIQIADAMTAAHAAGIVHRDLKPGNLMISRAGLVKILDFGLAKLARQTPAPMAAATAAPGPADVEATVTVATITSENTQMGFAVGSPAFMSPEQATGRPVDARSDIFSFGSILYEMFTGRRAFQGDRAGDVMAEVIHRDPPAPAKINPDLPPELPGLVMRALKKDPAQRIQTMAELKTALERHEDNSSAALLAAPAVARSRRRTIAIAAAAAAVVIVPLAYLALRKPAQEVAMAPLQASRLTLDPGLNIEPAISPDGKFVAYASDRSGEGNLDIWIRPASGSGDPVRLTRDPAGAHEPSFSPDGTQVVFRSEREGGGVYLVPASGGEPRKIIAEGRRPRFSPDGKQIAYWKGLADPFPLRAGNAATFVYDLASSQTRQIAPDFAAAADPVWSPEGKHILVIGLKDAMNLGGTYNWWIIPNRGGVAVRCPVNTKDLFVPFEWQGGAVFYETGGAQIGAKIGQVKIDPRTLQPVGSPANLTAGTTDEFSPAVSQGGKLVFSAETRNTNLYLLPLDIDRGRPLGPPQPRTHDLGENSVRSASADGKRVVFVARRPADGPAQIWGLDLDDGRERELTAGAVSKHFPEISPDGSLVAWREAWVRAKEIYVTPFEGGPSTKLCGDCQGQPVWSADGRFILAADFSSRGSIAIIERATGRQSLFIEAPLGLDLRARAISHDDKWLAFAVHRSPAQYTICVAPFAPDRAPPQTEWVEVASGADTYAYPRWSPDGAVLYFGSNRDGYSCLWAQRLDPRTKQPRGQAFPIQHFHHPTLILQSPSFNYPFALGPSQAALSITERTGGLWALALGRRK